MRPKSFMVIAGEASGDLLAAELVGALRSAFEIQAPPDTRDPQPLQASLAPRFFGAGGPRMAEAGVDLAFDMTRHSVIGLWEALKKITEFRRLFHRLYRLALDRHPEVILCVDFSGFNRRFAHAVRAHCRRRQGWFHTWNPVIVQYVSPQVWASRPGRAQKMAADYDLLLSILPFEKDWYARQVPGFRVEFVGNPIVERYGHGAAQAVRTISKPPMVLLLPGSREGELRRHLPVLIGALALMRASLPDLRARMVLPSETLLKQAHDDRLPPGLETRVGGLAESLAQADLALASTGTVTLECAWFGLPTVALYRTSWSTYQIGKRIIQVKYLAMPNLLADDQVYPEFIQGEATPENIARAALGLLQDPERHGAVQTRLHQVVSSLGTAGASARAASAIVDLLNRRQIDPG
jgi:lipid-A-disaccharide synthase